MEQNNNVCQGCGRHCPLTALSCDRGRVLNGQPTLGTGGRDGRGPAEHGGRGGHGRPEPDGQNRENGPHPGEKAQQECRRRYEAMPVEGQLRENLHRLGHMLYHSADHRGGQFRAMAVLASCGAMGQRELGEYLDVRAGSLSELLTKLETAGYITRSVNAQDRRNTDVALTESGRAASAQHEAERTEKTRALFTALSAEEKQQLNGLLERLTADWRSRVFPPEAAQAQPETGEARRGHGRRSHF